MLKSRPMTLVQGPEFLQTLSRGTFASKFSPRATQGQITSYCETRRVLVPPASACRSSYIIFIIIVLLDPEDKGPNYASNPTGYWPGLQNKEGQWLSAMLTEPELSPDCEKDLSRVPRSVRERQQISVERSWHHLKRRKLPTKLLFRKPDCGTIKRLLFTAVTHNTSPHSHSEREQTDVRLSKPSQKFHQIVTRR